MVKNLIGLKFGKLTIIEQHGFTEKNKHGSRQAIWYCKCDCGNYCEMASGTLTRKRNNHSCGLCKSTFRFESEDVKEKVYESNGGHSYYYVSCPVCKNEKVTAY